jgi:hypothetical protein
MGDLRRVHCRHCGQTFLSDDLEKCAACLRVGGISEPGKPTDRPGPPALTPDAPPHQGALLSEADAIKQLVEQKQAEGITLGAVAHYLGGASAVLCVLFYVAARYTALLASTQKTASEVIAICGLFAVVMWLIFTASASRMQSAPRVDPPADVEYRDEPAPNAVPPAEASAGPPSPDSVQVEQKNVTGERSGSP